MTTTERVDTKPGARKLIQVDTTVGDAINTMCSCLEDLATELREWYDNMPENLQGGSKVDEAANVLEDISEPDVPDFIKEAPVTFQHPPPKKRQSRAARRDDAVAYGQAALEVIEERLEATEGGDDHGALESLRDDVQEIIDNAEGVDFPGAR